MARAPLVGIIMGSQSDWATMAHAADVLKALAVPFETRIVSAHRTPKRLVAYAEGAAGRGRSARVASVMMPSVPSEPIISLVRS